MLSFTSAEGFSRDDSIDLIEDLIVDVHAFIDRIQHLSIRDTDWLEKMQQTGEELASKVSALAVVAGEKQTATLKVMKIMAERLRLFAAELASYPSQQSILKHRDALARVYEEFLIELKKRRIEGAAALTQINHLKPVNYSRNIFHASMALFGVICYFFFLTRVQALAILGSIAFIFGSLEISRRFSPGWNDFLCDKVFKSIARPAERYKVNSATIFVLALFVIVFFFPKIPVLAATLILGFSDPVATLAGKRWGIKKIYRDKSIVGSLAFFVTGFLIAALFLFFAEPLFAPMHVLFIAAGMAFFGMIAELFSGRIDDNFSVPVVCAFVGTIIIFVLR